jgi:transposase
VLDWPRTVIDGLHLRAMKGGPKPDRARSTVPELARNILITEAHGIPLQASLTGGNRNDVTQLMPVIQDIPPVRGRRGRPRRRPDTVYADRAYDHDKYRKQVRAVGVTPVIARHGTEHGSGLGQYRWVVEQTFAPLHWFRRLRIRWEIRDDIHEAFLRLACAIICLRRLTSLSPLLGVHLPGFRGRIDRPLGRWIPMWYPPMATSSSARDPVMRFSAVRT